MNLGDIDNDRIDRNSPIQAAGPHNPFSIPKHYFEFLKQRTLTNHELLQVVDNNSRSFTIPEGYFDELSESIRSKILLEDIKSDFPGNGMVVASGYFESARDRIILNTNFQAKNSKKIVNLFRKRWTQYGAAASLVIAISAAVYFNQRNSSMDSQLAHVSEGEIIYYLQTNSEAADIQSIIENLNDTDLSSNIDPNISAEDLSQYIKTSYN